LTVTTHDDTVDPQLLVSVYRIVSRPAVIPLTTPVPVTVALALEADHTPDPTETVNVVELPIQTLPAPLIIAAAGNGLIVTTLLATEVPQALLTL
jgi:hypothetical protein